MTLTITQEKLALISSCDEARAAIAARFPEGMPVTPENIEYVLSHPDGVSWLNWLLRSRVCPATVRAQYDAASEKAWARHDAVVTPARATYDAAVAPSLAQYDATVAEAMVHYGVVDALARGESATSPRLVQYETVRTEAWERHVAETAGEFARFKEVADPAWEQHEAAVAPAIRTAMLAWAAMTTEAR